MNCTGDCKSCLEQNREMFADGRAHIAEGVAVIPHTLKTAGDVVQQHAHRYDHTTYIASGGIRVWLDGVLDGDHHAPKGLLIPAEMVHHFEALADDTTILCIHNVSRTGSIETVDAQAEQRRH